MPSLVLDNKIHHSILFSREPLHSLPIKFFGSTCFVHNFNHSLDKLSSKSHEYVFIGFTRSQKGYKCFFPFLNRCFVFEDVTLHEFSFYFNSPPSFDMSPSTTVTISVICDPPIGHSPPSYSHPMPPL